nr:MAG TPA: hypothetical protein [Caudoviricetes sp.]
MTVKVMSSSCQDYEDFCQYRIEYCCQVVNI